ncbi:hypothetical protein N7454_005229 [Penicillium verhagenii]|nr:hypothetical protein N7454_005229 [Penicillium verhagenii]
MSQHKAEQATRRSIDILPQTQPRAWDMFGMVVGETWSLNMMARAVNARLSKEIASFGTPSSKEAGDAWLCIPENLVDEEFGPQEPDSDWWPSGRYLGSRNTMGGIEEYNTAWDLAKAHVRSNPGSSLPLYEILCQQCVPNITFPAFESIIDNPSTFYPSKYEAPWSHLGLDNIVDEESR